MTAVEGRLGARLAAQGRTVCSAIRGFSIDTGEWQML